MEGARQAAGGGVDPGDGTRVDVWDDRRGRFVPTRAGKVRCHTCDNADPAAFWWDGAMLVCRCGEQFFPAD